MKEQGEHVRKPRGEAIVKVLDFTQLFGDASGAQFHSQSSSEQRRANYYGHGNFT